ncbi:MAG TPA: ester cyclase [Hanamia sp.]
METLKKVDLSRKKEATSIEEQNKKLVRYAVEEVWNQGNYSVADEIVSSDFVIHSSNPDKEIHGPQGVRQFFTSLRAAFPDIQFAIRDQVAEGNKVVTHWIAEGTHQGSYEGIAATGKHFKVTAIDIDYIRNGKFTECWTNMDELGMLQQLGILNNNDPGENVIRQAWDKIAEGYNQFVTDTEIWLANEALKRVGLLAGQSFLDVAAGCGGLSLPAARLGAKVLATDWSPEMIRLFEERVNKEGLSNAKGQIMDAHHLELEDNQFDISGSQFGVMLLPDLPKALKEMVRVTKPGGKVLLITYGAPEKIEFLNFFIKALQFVAPHFPGLPTNPPPLEFQVADAAVLRQRLVEAGLKNVKVETVTEKLEFNSGQQFWDWTLNGNPIVGHVLSQLDITDEQIEIIKQQLDQMIRERAGVNSTAILTDPVNIGFGTKENS